MIIIDCKQGTPEWLQARAGVITASTFSDAVSTVGGLTAQQKLYVNAIHNGFTAKEAMAAAGYKSAPTSDAVARALRGEDPSTPSDASNKLACDLAIERISKKPYGAPVKAWTLERGHEMEDLARIQYEVTTQEFVTESGLVLTNDRVFGYSTDGLVGSDGFIEVKAPVDSLKIEAMLMTDDTSEYEHQIQGGFWITGRDWCDFLMPVPDLDFLYKKRIYRDDDFIDDMVEKLLKFADRVAQKESFFKLKAA